MTKKLAPMHPGEVLREEFLVPLRLSAGALARKMDVPRTRVERIAEGTTGITADTALRLSKALGTTPQLWLNLQNDYDLKMATRALGKKLAKIEPLGQETVRYWAKRLARARVVSGEGPRRPSKATLPSRRGPNLHTRMTSSAMRAATSAPAAP